MATFYPDPAKFDSIIKTREKLSGQNFLVLFRLNNEEIVEEKPAPVFSLLIKRDFYLWVFLPEIIEFFQEYIEKDAKETILCSLSISHELVPFNIPFGLIFSMNYPKKGKKIIEIEVSFKKFRKEISFLLDFSHIKYLEVENQIEKIKSNKEKLQKAIQNEFLKLTVQKTENNFDKKTEPVINQTDYNKCLEKVIHQKIKSKTSKYTKLNFKDLINHNLKLHLQDVLMHRWKESFFIKTENYDLIRKELQIEDIEGFYSFLRIQNIERITEMTERLFLNSLKKKETKFDTSRFLVYLFFYGEKFFVCRKNIEDVNLKVFLEANFPDLGKMINKVKVECMGIYLGLELSMVAISALFGFVDHVLYLVLKFDQ